MLESSREMLPAPSVPPHTPPKWTSDKCPGKELYHLSNEGRSSRTNCGSVGANVLDKMVATAGLF